MIARSLAESNKLDIIRLCHSGLGSRALRAGLLKCLRRVIAFDYAYFSTTDPATQLITSSVMAEEPPSWLMARFVENEFLHEDFIKFAHMFRRHQSVGILSAATENDIHRSLRYHDMLLPLTMEDEMRAIFVADNACWGTLCLHRAKARSGYSQAEAAYLGQIAPHIADGLRKALLIGNKPAQTSPDAPGVLILAEDLSIMAATAAAEFWLNELAEVEKHLHDGLPLPVRSVVARLKTIERGIATEGTPKVRIRTQSGHWLMLYASRLNSPTAREQTTVIFEIARRAELAPLIMQSYLLTKREGEITQCVLLGWSTTEIAARLHISPNTVQDHLKAIFEKVDVSSRGELAARIFSHQ